MDRPALQPALTSLDNADKLLAGAPCDERCELTVGRVDEVERSPHRLCLGSRRNLPSFGLDVPLRETYADVLD